MDKKEKLTQIVKEVQNDKGQFELLYSQIINKVYFWCFTIVGHEATANDLAQESIIRIYNKLHTLKNPDGFTSWMYILVRNVCNGYLRAHKNDDKLFLNSKEFSTEYEETIKEERRDNLPHEVYSLNETKRLVSEFVEKLPKKQREVITLFYLEELKIEEIAEFLDYNTGSVKSRLHSGRKNLEMQIIKYQEKHNVKLYTTAILPILGLILYEHMVELSDRQDLSFDNNINHLSKVSRFTKIANVISSNLVTIVSIVTVMTLITAIVILNTSSNNNDVFKNLEIDDSFIEDIDMFNKVNNNLYIDSINYITFSKRDSVDIAVYLKEKAIDKDIYILFDNEEVMFDKSNDKINFRIYENGSYTIVVNDKKISFEMNNLDKYAPELSSVDNYDNYIELNINDELSKIDYEKSYVDYKGKSYRIEEDSKVYGQFTGIVKIIIFDKEGFHIGYELHFE